MKTKINKPEERGQRCRRDNAEKQTSEPVSVAAAKRSKTVPDQQSA
jgi:hypothetical protein